MAQVGADLLIRALGVARDALEMLLVFGVVVDLEVIGLVDVPVELVVVDLVLAVVRRELRLRVDLLAGAWRCDHEHSIAGSETLRVRLTCGCQDESRGEQADGSTVRDAHAHTITS